MPPQNPPHAGPIGRITELLIGLFGGRAVVRVQCALLAGRYHVPEPDFAVVPDRPEDCDTRHPERAHLVIEVADTSLPSDRLSTSRIYAAADVPQYLIVNVRGDCVEAFADPEPASAAGYRFGHTYHRGGQIALVDFPGMTLEIASLLPSTLPAGLEDF
jgi:putative restriction endonuclease